ncbi:hypothetical protein Lesp02_79740 [Lentzea sp. NBRC 105346]|uniref:hypothetical protein n=1 Tax=Lentzea sp. NBRC 105346 TaxID=3032205 RepID=UPI0024A336D4|nr:hypothetical protein [Lentzea sp. NBRC 105346]GLZ35787.1 hypothetical protein Lesp02_79740 [Lentzea sp. NBRC 105346]
MELPLDLTLPRSVVPPHVVRLEVDTFADLRRDAGQLAAWFGEVFATLLVPLCPASVKELVEVARGYHPSDTTPWGPPGYARLLLSAGDFTVDAWARQLDALSRGESDFLRVMLIRLDDQGLPTTEGGWCAEITLKRDPEFPHQVIVTAAREAFGGWVSRVVQQDWLKVLATGATLAKAAHGWITLDRVGARTAYEQHMGIGIDAALVGVADYARGVHWATVLGPRQVAQLGGVERVLRDAPCVWREHLGGGRILLKLTDDLEDTKDLEPLHRFLAPVLIGQ